MQKILRSVCAGSRPSHQILHAISNCYANPPANVSTHAEEWGTNSSPLSYPVTALRLKSPGPRLGFGRWIAGGDNSYKGPRARVLRQNLFKQSEAKLAFSSCWCEGLVRCVPRNRLRELVFQNPISTKYSKSHTGHASGFFRSPKLALMSFCKHVPRPEHGITMLRVNHLCRWDR
jgi:hypothetical protein